MQTIRIALITALVTTTVFAQTAQETITTFENEGGFGIRAAAMGNAYTGLADDYSAIYWNPAGLAQIEFGNISAALQHNNFENSVDYFGENSTDSRTFTKLQHLGMAYSFPVLRGSFVIAMGYQKVNNLDFFSGFSGFATTDNDFGFVDSLGTFEPAFNRDIQQDISVFDEGSIDNWSFAVAVDLSRNFSAGLTLNFIGGDRTYNYDYFQEDINGNWQTFPDDFSTYTYNQKILTDYTGFNAKVGALFHLSDKLQFGTTITFPYSVTVDEEYNEGSYLVYDDGFEYDYGDDSGTFDYIINIPFQFGAGLAFTSNLFTVSTAIDYRDWSQLKYEVPDNRSLSDDYDDLLSLNNVIRENYRSVLSWAVGGELNVVNTGLLVRGGYRYLPNPEKNLESDFDKKFYSFGLGYNVDKRTSIDFSFTQGEWKQNFDYVYSAESVEESIQSQVFRFGLNYNF